MSEITKPIMLDETGKEIIEALKGISRHAETADMASDSEKLGGKEPSKYLGTGDVPEWAKQPNKPTYTASEVGALPSDGKAVDSDKLNGNPASYYATTATVTALSDDLTSEISRSKEAEELLKSRIDTITSLPEGSTTGDAELQDIRVKADGTTATSAGNAVREQVSELKGDLVDVENKLIPVIGINETYRNISKDKYTFFDLKLVRGEKYVFKNLSSTVYCNVRLCRSADYDDKIYQANIEPNGNASYTPTEDVFMVGAYPNGENCDLTIYSVDVPYSKLDEKVDSISKDVEVLNQNVIGLNISIDDLLSEAQARKILTIKGLSYSFTNNTENSRINIRTCNSLNYSDSKRVIVNGLTYGESAIYTADSDSDFIGFYVNDVSNASVTMKSCERESYEYDGEKIDYLIKNKYSREILFNATDFGSTSLPMDSQGFDIFSDKYLVQGSQSSTVSSLTVIDLYSKNILSEITFDDVLSNSHNNCINFGEKYSENDVFPMLYISKGPDDYSCKVIRLSNDAKTYSVIQSINYSSNGVLPKLSNWAIDCENGYIYHYGALNVAGDPNDNSRIYKFALPNIKNGDVVFTEDDIVDDMHIYDLRLNQGVKVIDNKFISATGLNTTTHPSYIKVVDLFKKCVVSKIDTHFIGEVEGISVYKNKLVTNNNETWGYLRYYGLDF